MNVTHKDIFIVLHHASMPCMLLKIRSLHGGLLVCLETTPELRLLFIQPNIIHVHNREQFN